MRRAARLLRQQNLRRERRRRTEHDDSAERGPDGHPVEERESHLSVHDSAAGALRICAGALYRVSQGNVRGHNAGGNQLETEQLFWNQKSKLVYSNVDSKITQNTDVVYGDGFESDERFEEFVVRNPKGKVTVETAPNRSDTTEKAPEAAPKPDVPADVPVIREGEGVANPATIRNQRKRRDEPRMLGKPVKLERFDRPGRPEADAAGSRRP